MQGFTLARGRPGASAANPAAAGPAGASSADGGLAAGRVRKIDRSLPRQPHRHPFDRLCRAGKIELERVPQGNPAERIRAAGAGIGGFFRPAGRGTGLWRCTTSAR